MVVPLGGGGDKVFMYHNGIEKVMVVFNAATYFFVVLFNDGVEV